MATAISKTYIYKLYQGSLYLQDLPNVISPFTFTQLINSAGAQLEVEISNKFDDVGAIETDTFWVDQSGNNMVDENNNNLIFAKSLVFQNIHIDLGNRVKVFKYDSYTPNGVVVFDGLISQWETSYSGNTIKLTVLSFGVQLSNFIIASDSAGNLIDQESYNKEYFPVAASKNVSATPIAQSFNVASPTLVGSFGVFTRASAGDFFLDGVLTTPIIVAGWTLYAGIPTSPGPLVDSGTIVSGEVDVRLTILQLTTPQTLSGNYFLVLDNQNGGTQYYADLILEATNTNPYAGGSVYTGITTNGVTAWTAVSGDDLAFIVYESDGSSALSFNSIDPGQIARSFMQQVINQGGIPSFTTSSIDLTATSASYDFKIASAQDGLNKALSLAPDGWYWYYDIPTNLVHFHQSSLVATHTLVLGVHFIDADITYSLETVVNSIYFSGGDTGGGANLFSVYSSPSSIAGYGKWTELLSDNRVTLQETADTIARSEISSKQTPLFQISLTVSDGVYDLESFVLGQMVQLRNFNNLLENQLYQIVSIQRSADNAILKLGNLPPRASADLQAAKNRLDALETINNPVIPT